MRVNLLADIFNANWEAWQDIAFILLIVLAVGLLFFGIAFLLISNSRMEADGRRMAKRKAWYEKQLETKRRALELEKEQGEQELDESRKELEEKRKAAAEAEAKAKETREQLIRKKQELSELLNNLETTQEELAEYLKRDGTIVPTDVVVNISTEKVLSVSGLPMNPAYTDCKIPTGTTFDFTVKDITDYIHKKPNISFTAAVGKRPASFKFEDKANKTSKSFALVSDMGGGIFRITFKCGPDYGMKLCKHLMGSVNVSKYPSGLVWFTVNNEKSPCSLEFIKLLIDISYRIAKIGY